MSFFYRMRRRETLYAIGAGGLGFTIAGYAYGETDMNSIRGNESGPDDEIDPRWTYRAAGSLSGIDDRRLYGRVRVDETTNRLVALDVASGEPVWEIDEAGWGELYTEPVIDDLTYYGVTSDVISVGALRAVDDNGTELWAVEMGSVQDPPVVSDDRIFVASADGTAYAVDTHAGDTVWSTSFDSEATAPRPSIEAVEDDVVYVVADGVLRALSADSGTELWAHRLTRDSDVSTELVDKTLYFAAEHEVGAVVDGELRWTNNGPDKLLGVIDGRLYVKRGRIVEAIDIDDGTVERRQENVSAAYAGEDRLFVVSDELRSITPDGDEAWSTTLDREDIISIVSDSRSVYAFTQDGVYRLTHDGEIESRADISPVRSYVSDSTGLYVSTDDRTLRLKK